MNAFKMVPAFSVVIPHESATMNGVRSIDQGHGREVGGQGRQIDTDDQETDIVPGTVVIFLSD